MSDFKVGNNVMAAGVVGKITRVIERYEVDNGSVFNREELTPVTTPVREDTISKRSCNRHNDCAAAEVKVLAENPGKSIHPDFHCHDDECEDCFGC